MICPNDWLQWFDFSNFIHFLLDLLLKLLNILSLINFDHLLMLLFEAITGVYVLVKVLTKILLVAKHSLMPLNIPLMKLFIRHFSEIVNQLLFLLKTVKFRVHFMKHLFLLLLVKLHEPQLVAFLKLFYLVYVFAIFAQTPGRVIFNFGHHHLNLLLFRLEFEL